jgi:hypothetical protein
MKEQFEVDTFELKNNCAECSYLAKNGKCSLFAIDVGKQKVICKMVSVYKLEIDYEKT